MYKRLYIFSRKKWARISTLIWILTEGSTTHIHLIAKIRNKTDRDNHSCGIFVDFRKAFDTVDHHILSINLERYGIRGSSKKALILFSATENSLFQ